MKRLLLILPFLFLFAGSAQAALTTNLTSYYKFQGNSNDSVASNNGTDSSITYSTGNGFIGEGAGFNGSSSNISVPSGIYTLSNGTSAFSVNGWFKIPSSGTYFLYMTNASAATNHFGEMAIALLPQLYMQRGDGSAQDTIEGATTPSNNVWHMFTATYDGSNMRVYLDGNLDHAAVASTRTQDTATLGVIGEEKANNTTDGNMNGPLDEMGWWSRALSQTEITELYNNHTGCQYLFSWLSNPQCLGAASLWPQWLY